MRDRVTPETALAVLERDGGCLAKPLAERFVANYLRSIP